MGIEAMDRHGQQGSEFSVNRATEIPMVILAILLRQADGEDCGIDLVPSLDIAPDSDEMEQSHSNDLLSTSAFS